MALEVGGSSPLGHPIQSIKAWPAFQYELLVNSLNCVKVLLSCDLKFLAPLAQWQSNGLLIRRFWVRIPGGAPGQSAFSKLALDSST